MTMTRITAKTKRGVLYLLLIAFSVLALFQADLLAGVSGSKHDLSINGSSQFKFDTDQVCVFCHTPHGANSAVTGAKFVNGTGLVDGDGSLLLWNRELSNATTFVPYTSESVTNTITTIRTYTLLCMSCHDGVGAMNILVRNPGPPGWDTLEPLGGYSKLGEVLDGEGPIGWGPNIGEMVPGDTEMHLKNDHPISINYGDCGDGCNPIEDVEDAGLRFYPDEENELLSVECSTCHDVHNQGVLGEPGSLYPFLRVTVDRSTLCLTCHIK